MKYSTRYVLQALRNADAMSLAELTDAYNIAGRGRLSRYDRLDDGIEYAVRFGWVQRRDDGSFAATSDGKSAIDNL